MEVSTSQNQAPGLQTTEVITKPNGTLIDLLDFLLMQLTSEQQQVFARSAWMYLHRKGECCIDLEDLMKWMGLKKKDKLKAKLVNNPNFQQGRDYIKDLLPTGKNPSGGRPSEKFFLTPRTFKKLCAASDTTKGDEIREYFVMMEEHLLEYIQMKGVYELRLQQEANAKLIQAAEAAKNEAEAKAAEEHKRREELELKLRKRTYEAIKRTGHVYVIETDGGIKVGRTCQDVSKRVKGMQTGNRNDIRILLDFETSNPDLLERTVHYILDRYRTNSNREFFDCNTDHIQRVVILAGNTIDTLKSMYENITEDEFIMRVNENVGIQHTPNLTPPGPPKETSAQGLDDPDDLDDQFPESDDYQPFDDPELSLIFKRAFSGIDSNFGTLVSYLNRGRVVSSGEEDTKWLKVKGFRWLPAVLGDIKELMNPLTDGAFLHTRLREAHQHYLNKGNKKLAAQIQKVTKKVQKESFMTRVAKQSCARLLKEDYEDIVARLDGNKNLLGFNNGVYDLERGLFRDGRPNDYISKSVGYEYVPNDHEHRTEIEHFFVTLFPDQELRDYVMRYLASCLSGNTQDQMIFLAHGGSQSSSLLALMKEALGPDYASTTDTVTGRQRSDFHAVLKGKRFVYSQTVEKINEGAFKTMIGNTVSQPDFKLFLVCNHLPKFSDVDLVRRIRVIPFKPESQNDWRNTKSWRSSFMCLLLEKYREYKRHGLADKPKLVAAMTRGCLVNNDPVKAYLQMECERVPVEESRYWVPPREFYRIFQTWCTENGFLEAVQWGEKKCWEEFQKHGAVKERSRRGRENSQFIKGFQLLNRTEDE
ncbi:hypothetical protein HK102_001894 [Quaeritorhiza haematococci]|nr:hypothetical protein HK102_001894 [Quaeritorhiza haematococci]